MRKTYVTFDGAIHKVDTIRWKDSFWLVPNWLDTPDGKHAMPTRIIRLDTIRHAPMGNDFVVQSPMPKELFGDRTPKEPIAGYEYLELPNIAVLRQSED
jgi:hypothetical protein